MQVGAAGAAQRILLFPGAGHLLAVLLFRADRAVPQCLDLGLECLHVGAGGGTLRLQVNQRERREDRCQQDDREGKRTKQLDQFRAQHGHDRRPRTVSR